MKKILLIDDEKETSLVFQTALQSSGYEVVLAPDGKTGLDFAQKDKYDGILLDQILPDLPGNEVLKTLKSNEATKAVPVAMLTNFGQDEMIKEALANGASEYILKYAISPEDLAAKVKGLVGE